jgi:peptide-methionine (S)-S-oxide reductase
MDHSKRILIFSRLRLVAALLMLLGCMPFAAARAGTATADFAMGCFWCAEHDFEKLPGVTDVVSGYEGGTKESANYKQVSTGTTGHFETVRVDYDPAKIGYGKLLAVFWDNIDPFDAAGQFCDHGRQYSAVIFTANAEERTAARKSLDALQARHPDKKVTVQILDAQPFYPAEAHHQNFAEENSMHYKLYRAGCGRDARLDELRR